MTYSINIAKCRGCIYETGLEDSLASISASLMAPENQAPFQFYCWDHDLIQPHKIGGVTDLELDIAPFPTSSVPREIRKSIKSWLCFFLTSVEFVLELVNECISWEYFWDCDLGL